MREDNNGPSRPVAVPEAGLPALANAYGDDKRFEVTTLDDPHRQAMWVVVKGVQRLDGTTVNSFGAEGQRAANRHLDALMAQMTAADAGAGGAMLAELATGVRMLDLPALKAEAEGKPVSLVDRLSALPVVGRHFSAFARFAVVRQKAVTLFEKVEREASAELTKIQARDATLDRMVDDILTGLDRMKVELIAGQVILNRERRLFAEEKARVVDSRDPLALVALRDRAETIDAFEARLLRLHVAYTQAVLEVPRTRMAQNVGRSDYRTVLETVLFDIPEIKRRIITLGALRGNRLARERAVARRDLNKALDAAAMDDLETAYVAAKEREGGDLEEITAMGEIATRLVALVGKGAEIDAANRTKRDAAHRALSEVRAKLATGLATAVENAAASISYGR